MSATPFARPETTRFHFGNSVAEIVIWIGMVAYPVLLVVGLVALILHAGEWGAS